VAAPEIEIGEIAPGEIETGEIATIDGVKYSGSFRSFDTPLEVRLPDAPVVYLMPWRYRAHMAALRDCLVVRDGGLALDIVLLCSRVLADSDVPRELHAALAPLALWWAAGGGAELPAVPEDAEWVDLGSTRARLRGWSERERVAALLAARIEATRTENSDGAPGFDIVGYLQAMVAGSVVGLASPEPVEMLDSRATACLLAAVVARNVPDLQAEPALQAPMADAARQTLRLCRALGWTPSQVWSAPAAEIERLLHLLALVEPETPAPETPTGETPTGARPAQWHSARRRIADHPDAVVLQFGTEGE
jgi:hypothetical protein